MPPQNLCVEALAKPCCSFMGGTPMPRGCGTGILPVSAPWAGRPCHEGVCKTSGNRFLVSWASGFITCGAPGGSSVCLTGGGHAATPRVVRGDSGERQKICVICVICGSNHETRNHETRNHETRNHETRNHETSASLRLCVKKRSTLKKAGGDARSNPKRHRPWRVLTDCSFRS